jgi:hypothetical protein
MALDELQRTRANLSAAHGPVLWRRYGPETM